MILFVSNNPGILFLGVSDLIEHLGNEILKFGVYIKKIMEVTVER